MHLADIYEKILNSLLNSCTLALNADSGSVMTLDGKTKRLHIKVASKLDEKIVDRTKIKLGEGIAGVAAATSESIILPKDKDKSGLSKKMRREYIKSSMIVPFNKGNTADVKVKGFLIGKSALLIDKKPDGFYISRGNGIHAPRLNGKSIRGKNRLKNDDFIDIGATKIHVSIRGF